MPALGSSLVYPLGSPQGGLTSDQVLDLFVQLFPVKFAQWTGIINKRGDVYNVVAAIADALKAFVYDGIAVARGELNPMTAGYRLADYEAWLGLTSTPTALTGTPAARRAQIVSKMREQGASTLANVRAVLAPLLGYTNASQLQIVEANRAALTALHTYTNSAGATLGALASTTQTVYVSDDGGVGDAGAQLLITLTCTNPEQLSFVLTGPNQSNATGSGQAVVTFPAGTLKPGALTGAVVQINDPTVSPGKKIFGTWSLQVTAGAAGCSFSSWSLFVEGGGSRDSAGNSGLGEQMHDWIVVYSSLLGSSPDFTAARAALTRIQPADSTGTLVQNSTAVPSSTLYPPFEVLNS